MTLPVPVDGYLRHAVAGPLRAQRYAELPERYREVTADSFYRLWNRGKNMEERIYREYLEILREELVPAMGCTEPIAVAYCAALARQTL